MFRNTWNQRTNPSQHIWRVWDQNFGKKNILKFFHFDNLICILWSNLEVSYDSGSLVSCWHMSRGQPSQTVLKSVDSLALYDFLKFYLIYYPTAPLSPNTCFQNIRYWRSTRGTVNLTALRPYRILKFWKLDFFLVKTS